MVNHTFKSTLAITGLSTAMLAGLASCRSTQPAEAPGGGAALRPIVAPAGSDASTAQRARLARFVGLWNFEGWAIDATGQRSTAKGKAAAAIEKEHFVLVEVRAAAGSQLAGRAGRTSASLLLGSEPGVGVTLTAWGDASPAVSRLIGAADATGSTLNFREARTPDGVHTAGISITFQSDDKWTAELRDADDGNKLLASYTFTRAGN